MATLSLLLRARFRHRRSWLSLCLLCALFSGLVLAATSAGHRTATAFPAYTERYGYDAFVISAAPLPAITTLPGVASATLMQTVAAGTPDCACSRPISGTSFNLTEVAPGDLSRVVKLVAGRMPDQSDPWEVLASFRLQQDAGVRVGTVIRVPLYSSSQRGAVLSGASVRPAGATVRLRVVGIEANESEFPFANSTGYDLYATAAFARLMDTRTVHPPFYLVRLRDGASGLPRFQVRARTLGALAVADVDTAASAIDSSIRPQVAGWWILAGLIALAGMVVVAQALGRQAAIDAEPYPALSALGASRRQLAAASLTATLVIAVAGVILGVLLAVLLSPLTPVGEARIADPSGGFALDPIVVLSGAGIAVLTILALGTWPAVRAAGHTRPSPTAPAAARPSRIAALLAYAGAPASALIGVRHALERGRGRGAGPAWAALLGAMLTVAALCAATVFGASLGHLTGTPALYGQPFDLWFTPGGSNGATAFQALEASLDHDTAISDITLGAGGDVTVDGRIVAALAGQSLRGQALVVTDSGRAPRAAGEVALGALTLRQLGAHIGSVVRVTVPRPAGGTRTARYRVTGTVVFPPDFGTGGLGAGALFTLDGLLTPQCASVGGRARLACQLGTVAAAGGNILVRAVPGPRGQADLARLARAYPANVNFPVPPTNLVNFGEEVNFPALFGLAVTVFGVATLLQALVVSVARRRREIGLLKVMGFVRSQAALVVVWQTTTIAAVGLVVGLPTGIAVGRIAWRVFADDLGFVAAPVVSAWAVAAVAAAVVAIAIMLAIGPALAAARARPANLLRTQ